MLMERYMFSFLKGFPTLSCFLLVIIAIACTVLMDTFNNVIWATSDSPKPQMPEIDVTWAQPDADRIAIFLCTKKQGKWGQPEKIHDLFRDDLHPTVDRDGQNRIWLAWTAIDYQDFQIHYTIKNKGIWTEPDSIPVTTENNIAPYLLIINNVPWLVWSGNNSDDDDIYYSRFIDGAWTPAKLVHPDNSFPDILPRLEVTSSGAPMVIWEQLSGSEYEQSKRVWNGRKWDQADTGASSPQQKASLKESLAYAVPGRVWDGRQWTKMHASEMLSTETEKHIKRNSKTYKEKIIDLPDFLDDIQSVYIRPYFRD